MDRQILPQETELQYWQDRAVYLEAENARLDNNFMERILRTPVVGRKNFYGSGSQWSGEFAAIAWTITATASRANLNPLPYLIDFLTACANNGGKPLEGQTLDRFLPWMMSEADKRSWAIGRSP